MHEVARCADLLRPLIDAALQEDWATVNTCRTELRQAKRTADQLKYDFRLQLRHNLMLPVSRAEISDMITVQAKVASEAKHIAGLIAGRHFHLPNALHSDFLALLNGSLACIQQAELIVDDIDNLVETGFGQNSINACQAHVMKLTEMESAVDELQVVLRDQLITYENDVHPVHLMFCYQVVERLSDLANRAQRVGTRLLLLLAR